MLLCKVSDGERKPNKKQRERRSWRFYNSVLGFNVSVLSKKPKDGTWVAFMELPTSLCHLLPWDLGKLPHLSVPQTPRLRNESLWRFFCSVAVKTK